MPLEPRVTSDKVWSLVTQNQGCGHGSNWAMMLLRVWRLFFKDSRTKYCANQEGTQNQGVNN